MALAIATQAPTFHALTGTQPVGRKQVATQADYAGTVVVLSRVADQYWTVVTRSARNAFTPRAEVGASAAIWFDRPTMRYVVDYVDSYGDRVEADRTSGLRAAIGVATSVTGDRWARQR